MFTVKSNSNGELILKFKNFLHRHRNKFIISGIVVGGCVVVSRYAQTKLKAWYDNEALEYLERNRRLQHFENVSRICNQTIISLLTTLHKNIGERFDTDSLIEQLKTSETKLQLWNELKIQIFAKLLCLTYSSTILIVILKVQLSIIGGFTYKYPDSFPAAAQEKYLVSCCQNLLDAGMNSLYEEIERNCSVVLKMANLKQEMDLCDLDNLFQSIHSALTNDQHNHLDILMRQCLTCSRHLELHEEPEEIIRDTMDLLSSEEVKAVMTHLLCSSFMLTREQIFNMFHRGTQPNVDSVVNTNMKIHMVKLLPILNGIASCKKFSEELFQHLMTNPMLQTLAANIFESSL